MKTFPLEEQELLQFQLLLMKAWRRKTESIYFPIMPLRLLLMALDKKMEESSKPFTVDISGQLMGMVYVELIEFKKTNTVSPHIVSAETILF